MFAHIFGIPEHTRRSILFSRQRQTLNKRGLLQLHIQGMKIYQQKQFPTCRLGHTVERESWILPYLTSLQNKEIVLYIEEPTSFEVYKLSDYIPEKFMTHIITSPHLLEIQDELTVEERQIIQTAKSGRYEGHLYIELNDYRSINKINSYSPINFVKKLIGPLMQINTNGIAQSLLELADIGDPINHSSSPIRIHFTAHNINKHNKFKHNYTTSNKGTK